MIEVTQLRDLAKRVKRGVKLLDKKTPTWRRTLRKNRGTFNFASPDMCVIGTLIHHDAKFKKLRKQATREAFSSAVSMLTRKLSSEAAPAYGFDSAEDEINTVVYPALSALWEAEAGF